MGREKAGFTLIELMIVVAVISIIISIAVPNLLRSRLQSNESAAVGNLRALLDAQVMFAAAERGYSGDLDELRTPAEGPSYLDIDLSETVQGYDYQLAGVDDIGAGVTTAQIFENFECTADPNVEGRTGVRHFFVDASGVIRYATGGAADDASAPL